MTGPVTLFPDDKRQQQSLAAPLFEPDRLDSAVRAGRAQQPDSAARVLTLQQKTGLPLELIQRNTDQVERDASAGDFNAEAYRQKSPVVAAWMAEHPVNAAAAMDDLDQLSFIERNLTSLKRGFDLGKKTSEAGRIAFDELTRGIDPQQKARLDYLKGQLEREPVGKSFWDNVVFQGSKIVGQMFDGLPEALPYGLAGASAGAVAGLAGGPLAPATSATGAVSGFGVGLAAGFGGYTFAVEAGQAYQDLREIKNEAGERLSEGAIRAASTGIGTINAMLEVIGVEAIAKPFVATAARRFARDVAKDALTRPTMRAALAEFGQHYIEAIATETGTEVLQELSNITGEELAKMASNGQFSSVMSDPAQRELAVQRLVDIATQTAQGMLLVGLPGASINLASNVVSAKRAQQRADFYTALGEAVEGSKTFERLPEKLQEIVEKATAGGPIETAFVDIGPFEEYWQSQNVDPRAAAREILGDTDEYDQAVATRGALAIPMARYATRVAPTEHNKFFSREIRRAPEEINAREADELLAKVEAESKEQQQDQAVESMRQQLEQHIAEQIEATGRFKGGDATTLATQMASFFATQGQRYKADPLTLFNRYGLQVLRGELGPTLAEVPAPAAIDEETRLEREAIKSDLAPETTLRDAKGRLPTSLEHATMAQLVDEYTRLLNANQEDGSLVVPTVSPEANVSHRDGYLAHHVGMKGGAIMASDRIASRNKSIERLEVEIKRRGGDPMALYTQAVEGAGDVSFNPDEFQQRQGGQPRGRFRIMPGRQFAIDLLQNADFSTFLHESGHFYLEVMRDMAGESEEAAADAQHLLKWLGVKSFDEIGREHHEQFARGLEAYFMEGKAPSIELRRAFYRFKAWLKALYATIRSLEVDLTPQVRRVFDRMFATDAEIEAAENEAQIVPIFTTAAEAGMTDEEFAAYKQTVEDAHIEASDRLRAKAMKDEIRQQEQWYREARASVRGEVEGEVSQQPVYRVLAMLQKGELPDGTKLDAPVKLDRQSIVNAKGNEFLKRLPRPYVYAKEGGISPDQAAELFGFSSGDELLSAIANAPNRNQVIEGETDRRMQAQYGDMIKDGKLPDEAEKAVMEDDRDKIIRAELRALRKKASEVKPFVKAAKEGEKAATREGKQVIGGIPNAETVKRLARDRIAQIKVRDIKPHRYWVAARKANVEAFQAAADKDYVRAANAKQAELLNVELYRRATEIRGDMESIAEYARSLMKTPAQKRLGKAGADYLEQINGLLERFDFSVLPLSEGQRRQSLAAFIKAQEAKGLPVNIPEDIQNEAFRTPWRDLTHEEVSGIADVMRHIEHLATLKNKLLKAADQRELDAVTAEARQAIEDNAKRTLPAKLETRLPTEQAGRAISGWFAAHRKLASVLREMDGFKDGGVLWNTIMRPLNEAADRKALLNAEITEGLDALLDQAYSKKELAAMYRKEYVPSLHTSLTKWGRIMIALNWGAEDNRAKLVEGLKISTGNDISVADVEAVIDTLDQRDMQFVQGVWDAIGDYWPQLEGLAKRLDGIAPEKIEPAEIRHRSGLYRGGYFPLVYDDRQSRVAHRNLVAKVADRIKAGAAARASTKAGARNERVAGVRLPVRLDFGVVAEHFEEITQDLTHTEVLIDMGRIIGSDDVEEAVRKHYGDETYKLLLSALEDIAAGDVPAQNAFDKSLNWIRVGTSIAGLGWNLTTSLLQPLGLTQSMVRIGPKWVGKGLSRWIGDAASMENTVAWIEEKSTFMKSRTNTQMREVAEIRNKIGAANGRIATYVDMGISKVTLEKLDLQDVEDSYFWLITRMQLVADVPTWLGGYEKAMASGVDEAKAIAMADQAVIDAQGGGQIKDLADVQRGNPALKLWTNFYSFFNTTWNLHVESIGKTDFKSAKSIGRLAGDLLLLSVVPAALGYLVRNAVRGDGDDEGLAAALLREELGYLAGMLVGLREFNATIQGFRGYEGPTGARFFAEAGKLVKQVAQGDADRAAFRALNNTAGILFHYPAAQVQRTVDGFTAIAEGRTHNPAALLFGAPRK